MPELRRILLVACCLAPLWGCSVGHGDGEITGTAALGGCRSEGEYVLGPTGFFADRVQHLLSIRVQRGSDDEFRSDGLAVLVLDANAVARDALGRDLDLAADAGRWVELTAYFNETCPPGRDQIPSVLSAVGGRIRFDSIYAPDVDSGVRILAFLSDVRFEDPLRPDRWAVLSGFFDFLYVRGRPAQRYP